MRQLLCCFDFLVPVIASYHHNLAGLTQTVFFFLLCNSFFFFFFQRYNSCNGTNTFWAVSLGYISPYMLFQVEYTSVWTWSMFVTQIDGGCVSYLKKLQDFPNMNMKVWRPLFVSSVQHITVVKLSIVKLCNRFTFQLTDRWCRPADRETTDKQRGFVAVFQLYLKKKISIKLHWVKQQTQTQLKSQSNAFLLVRTRLSYKFTLLFLRIETYLLSLNIFESAH